MTFAPKPKINSRREWLTHGCNSLVLNLASDVDVDRTKSTTNKEDNGHKSGGPEEEGAATEAVYCGEQEVRIDLEKWFETDLPTKKEQMTPKTSTRSTTMVIRKGDAIPMLERNTVV